MRLADLAHPLVTTPVEHIVEFDAMGLRLSRYLGIDAAVHDGLGEVPAIGPSTLVLATVRGGRRLDGDLRVLGDALAGAAGDVLVLVCFEDDYENLPLPRIARFLDENGIEAANLSHTPYSRVRIAIAGLVRRAEDDERAEFAAVLRMRNDLVLGDFELRRLNARIDELAARTPATVTLTTPAEPRQQGADEELLRLQARVQELTEQVHRLREQRDHAVARNRATNAKLRGVRESATFRVGKSIVQAPRHPGQLAKLPADLLRSYRNRRSAPRPEPKVTPPAAVPRGLPGRRTNEPTPVRPAATATPVVLPPGVGASVSMAGLRLRAAVIGRPALIHRVTGGADVVAVQGGSWRPSGSALPPVDVLLVDVNAGRAQGTWAGLGEPGEVDRLRDLARLLDEAAGRNVPSVLLVDGMGIPAGLRGIESMASTVVAWTCDPTSGWDPGVALGQVPWPSARPRTAPVLRVAAHPAAPSHGAEQRWLSALPLRDVEHWLIGLRSRRLVDPLLGIDATGLAALPLPALATRPTVLVSSALDAWIAHAAVASGCHVLSRVPLDGIVPSPSFTVADDPRRARSLLEAGLGQPSVEDVLELLVGLLRRGGAHERMAALADLAGLPVAGALHRQVGISAVAVVTTEDEGRRFASELATQVRLPEDLVVVDLTEHAGDGWLSEVRATGVVTTVVRHPMVTWNDIAAQTMRDRVIVWAPQQPWSARTVAELELFAHRADGAALPSGGPAGAVIDRRELLTRIEPVTHRLPQTNAAAAAVGNGAA